MVIRVQTRVIVKTIIVYRQLPFERGFSLKLHKLQFHKNYLKLAKFFYEITSYADVFGTRGATADLLLLLLVF